MTATPIADPYRQLLASLRGEGDAPLLKRASELLALLDLATSEPLASRDSRARRILETVCGELPASPAAVFLTEDAGGWRVRASRGLPAGAAAVALDDVPGALADTGPGDPAHDRHGLALLVPLRHGDRLHGALGLGPREDGQPWGEEERRFLRVAAACTGHALEGGRALESLRRANQQLSQKVFQLHNLFDVSRDLSGSFAEEAIHALVATTVMGHFLVSRCALYRLGPQGLALAHGSGLGPGAAVEPMTAEAARAALDALPGPRAVGELPEGPLRRTLEAARCTLAVPLAAGEGASGVLAIGERASGAPFSEEDREFAHSLAHQVQAALENARLQRIHEEKRRQDRELQVARGIQRSLFPTSRPAVEGFDLAAESRPCYEVGGDAYDWIRIEDGRLALVVADVSGKGIPASLLMASVHASLQATAGTAAPARVVDRLNRFLYANSPASRYVTLFYGVLDAPSRRLRYVVAGHVPPFRVGRDGRVTRLREGGPAPGLVDTAEYEEGETRLAPGELLAVVTDGVTEAMSPGEEELGDERVAQALVRHAGGSAQSVLEGLVAAVSDWSGGARFADDLTALVLKG